MPDASLERERQLERKAEGLLNDAAVELFNNGASFALSLVREAERVLTELKREEAKRYA